MKRKLRKQRKNPDLSQYAFGIGEIEGEKLPKNITKEDIIDLYRDHVDYLLSTNKFDKTFTFYSFVSGIWQGFSNKKRDFKFDSLLYFDPIVSDMYKILSEFNRHGEIDIKTLYKFFQDADFYVNYLIDTLERTNYIEDKWGKGGQIYKLTARFSIKTKNEFFDQMKKYFNGEQDQFKHYGEKAGLKNPYDDKDIKEFVNYYKNYRK